MRTDLLLDLANYLEEKVQPIHFYMHTWVQFKDMDRECMTSACAAGHATYLPSFIAAGLYRTNEGLPAIGNKPFHRLGIQAMMEVLQINKDAAHWLFLPSCYIPYPENKPLEDPNDDVDLDITTVSARIRFLATEPDKALAQLKEWYNARDSYYSRTHRYHLEQSNTQEA